MRNSPSHSTKAECEIGRVSILWINTLTLSGHKYDADSQCSNPRLETRQDVYVEEFYTFAFELTLP